MHKQALAGHQRGLEDDVVDSRKHLVTLRVSPRTQTRSRRSRTALVDIITNTLTPEQLTAYPRSPPNINACPLPRREYDELLFSGSLGIDVVRFGVTRAGGVRVAGEA